MIITLSSVTDLGSRKKVNQDAMCALQKDTKIFRSAMGVICDGVGGCEHSEIASNFAVRAFSEWYDCFYPDIADITDEDEFCSQLYEKWFGIFDSVNSFITAFANANDTRLGSTFTCVMVRGNNYYILHIGDTRAYSISSEIKQLTVDHTVTQREVEKGMITPEEAQNDDRRHTLTKCLGLKDHIRPAFYTGSIENDTKFLICSDGFRDKLSEDELADILGREKAFKKDRLSKALKKIVKNGRAAGETDNVSAIVIQVSEER